MDNVKAAVETMAQLLTRPDIRAAWLNYAAADAERFAALDARVSDLSRNMHQLRGELDSAIAQAIRRELEGTELRVMGLGSLVDAMNAQSKALELLSQRMDAADEQRNEMLTLLRNAPRLVLPRPAPVEEEELDSPVGDDAGRFLP
jgi:seryl-tRNA synthetase